ncbi:uncharacterized protein BJ171DRAFT_513085 [Polychytrium aggregatum]|uniref:uncharacterized protein n=1 Tax=Polychytrium aggregatum TaxID=110093 RepID=UPI0022FE4305|nr:uncharacterized protein BJ171DRAFT_513085 [Polychytrium aggregatum]KAI9202732.1 hypothetical protein BJ171DRAFT_513085 [Polychytrium aggregatum]
MLPLNLLNAAVGHPVLIELKNGESYNGILVSCDNWMNVSLREVIQTGADGERFWRLPEAYIRGNTVKYLRLKDEVLIKALEKKRYEQKSGGHHDRDGNNNNNNRGPGGGRGGSSAGSRGGRGGQRGRGGGRGGSQQ